MFNASKYTRTYFALIENAKAQLRDKQDSYFERHHIQPRSMGGNDDPDNLVILTAREHFICHYLLTKMCLKKKDTVRMLHAFMLMKGQTDLQQRYFNSRLYDAAKAAYGESRSLALLGTTKSDEHRAKIAESLAGRITSEETKRKQSESASKRPRKPFSEEYRLKMSQIMSGKPRKKRAQPA